MPSRLQIAEMLSSPRRLSRVMLILSSVGYFRVVSCLISRTDDRPITTHNAMHKRSFSCANGLSDLHFNKSELQINRNREACLKEEDRFYWLLTTAGIGVYAYPT